MVFLLFYHFLHEISVRLPELPWPAHLAFRFDVRLMCRHLLPRPFIFHHFFFPSTSPAKMFFACFVYPAMRYSATRHIDRSNIAFTSFLSFRLFPFYLFPLFLEFRERNTEYFEFLIITYCFSACTGISVNVRFLRNAWRSKYAKFTSVCFTKQTDVSSICETTDEISSDNSNFRFSGLIFRRRNGETGIITNENVNDFLSFPVVLRPTLSFLLFPRGQTRGVQIYIAHTIMRTHSVVA